MRLVRENPVEVYVGYFLPLRSVMVMVMVMVLNSAYTGPPLPRYL